MERLFDEAPRQKEAKQIHLSLLSLLSGREAVNFFEKQLSQSQTRQKSSPVNNCRKLGGCVFVEKHANNWLALSTYAVFPGLICLLQVRKEVVAAPVSGTFPCYSNW
jgi:hypothetical protein